MTKRDFRTKGMEELTFYVVNDLRGHIHGRAYEMYRYDTAAEAHEKFKEFPEDWITAVGCSFGGVHETDLVHRIGGRVVLVTDYQYMEEFSQNPDVEKAIGELCELFHIEYDLISNIHPRRSVICPREPEGTSHNYMDNKVLYVPKSRRGLENILASINEVYLEGSGWMDGDAFRKLHPESVYDNPERPMVSKINVSYQNLETNEIGQADLSPQYFVECMKKTKEHFLSMEEHQPSVDEKIAKAKEERKGSEKGHKGAKEIAKKSFEMDRD